MRLLEAVVLVLVVAGTLLAELRFLRVAQREHYLGGEVVRFAWRWWTTGPFARALFAFGAAGAVASVGFPPVAVVAGLVAALGPPRLSVRGRSSKLAWTRRLTTLGILTSLTEAAAIALPGLVGGLSSSLEAAGFVALAVPLLVEAALLLARPAEEQLARRHVSRASSRLGEVGPLVVGLTGSFGKTTVKGYVAHLLAGQRRVVASPASYNNRAGLARAVNESLPDGTEVFVAEMGTYGPGEIRALCSWLNPEISAITAIGPAHLERFGSLEVTLLAKSEIAEGARVVVLNCDDERLASLAERLSHEGRKVVRASGSDASADVAVTAAAEGLELHLGDELVGRVALAESGRPTALSNAAVAAGIALELGVAPERILSALSDLPLPANRLERYVADGGYVVFDDTFNSNPQGALIALERLASEEAVSPSGRRVVVTPGMVELGKIQHEENARLGEEAQRLSDQLVVVARINRRALAEGALRVGSAEPVLFFDRLDEALCWVRGTLGPGDAVLYENDLPDHFP